MTPYYSDDLVTIYHAAAEDILPSLDSESVDIGVTSPPYNMGLKPGGNGRGMYAASRTGSKAGRFRDGYGTHGDDLPQETYDIWQRQTIAQMWRIAHKAVFYNHRPRVEHGRLRLPLGLDFGPAIMRQIIIWDRGTGIDVNLRTYCTRQEWIVLLAKPAFSLVDHAASGMGDIWRMGMATEEMQHPAPFPVSLPARAIATTGARSVLDPFLGSGTTLVAAKAAGIRGIGIEIEERWCERAAERCSQEVLGLVMT